MPWRSVISELRIWGSGVRIFPGAPLNQSLKRDFQPPIFPETCIGKIMGRSQPNGGFPNLLEFLRKFDLESSWPECGPSRGAGKVPGTINAARLEAIPDPHVRNASRAASAVAGESKAASVIGRIGTGPRIWLAATPGLTSLPLLPGMAQLAPAPAFAARNDDVTPDALISNARSDGNPFVPRRVGQPHQRDPMPA